MINLTVGFLLGFISCLLFVGTITIETEKWRRFFQRNPFISLTLLIVGIPIWLLIFIYEKVTLDLNLKRQTNQWWYLVKYHSRKLKR